MPEKIKYKYQKYNLNSSKSIRPIAKQKKYYPPGAKCGLCGKTKNLTKTPCCDQWICDDEDQYVMFSFANNSCMRNHSHYTLCGSHYAEDHKGDWKTCSECRKENETELYVWNGTNEYNFEKLPNPPSFTPKKCVKCGKIIHLGNEGYSVLGSDFMCEKCGNFF